LNGREYIGSDIFAKSEEKLRVRIATIGIISIDHKYDLTDGTIKKPTMAIDVRM